MWSARDSHGLQANAVRARDRGTDGRRVLGSIAALDGTPGPSCRKVANLSVRRSPRVERAEGLRLPSRGCNRHL